MAIGSGQNVGGLKGDINVTPLIDVLLVLLITFMVVVPVTPNGLNAQVPQPSNDQNHKADSAVVVQIVSTHSGAVSYKINQEDIELAQLEGRLRGIFAVQASKVMFIKGDGNLEFSTVAQVLDIGKIAGADDVGLLTPKNGM